MKVICEKYNKDDIDCKDCHHAKPHDIKTLFCKDNSELCGICSVKPLRKLKLEKLCQKNT